MQGSPLYFWSGSNRPGEIWAFSDCKVPFGVTVSELDRQGRGVTLVQQTDLPVFVDSGAFGEMFGPPIVDWDRRLDLYQQLSNRSGLTLCVAPDKVGDQKATFERLQQYRTDIRALANVCTVMVVLQKGALSQTDFAAKAHDLLGINFVKGVPMKRAATTLPELEALSRTLPPTDWLHLLGIGPYSHNFAAAVAACHQTKISCDSCRILALVGRTNGANGGPRPLTRHVIEITRELGLENTRLSSIQSELVKFKSLRRYLKRNGIANEENLPCWANFRLHS